MLKIKLFRAFALLVVFYSVLAALVAIGTIRNRFLKEAQNRVRLDLSSAWAVWNAKIEEIGTVVKLVSTKEAVMDAGEKQAWDSDELRSRLERIRTTFGLDFLDLIGPDGRVVLRAAPPFQKGDFLGADPAIAAALHGESASCVAILSPAELGREAEDLAERAFLQLEETPRARRSPRTEEERGMVMMSAVPIRKGAQVQGVVCGGILVNRNFALIDRIQDVVYKNETYKSLQLGTATVFLGDSRIVTTVRAANGNRALGTRVSKEVADQVLDNGRPWVGEAFVVRDWYLSAYDPIRNFSGQIIGMLYVGTLKRPFQDYARHAVLLYVGLSLFVLVIGLVLAFIVAGRLTNPIHRLAEASNRLCSGEKPSPVSTENAGCHETRGLIAAFNAMAGTLAEREERLRGLNRSYMETLGFVSHELKSPVATIMNYVYLLRQHKLGPLNEKQEKAVRAIDSDSGRLVEMVRHYLNLSRIENGDLSPVPSPVQARAEVMAPLLESAEAGLRERRMTVEDGVGDEIVLWADLNLVREVFENLLSNAIKYGRDGGAIRIQAARDGRMVQFSVKNEGAGIPPDQVGRLFQKFSRLENGQATRRQKGTGLGLFITRSIVEAHGGRIEVESRVNEWTEFRFSFPAHQPEATGGERSRT